MESSLKLFIIKILYEYNYFILQRIIKFLIISSINILIFNINHIKTNQNFYFNLTLLYFTIAQKSIYIDRINSPIASNQSRIANPVLFRGLIRHPKMAESYEIGPNSTPQSRLVLHAQIRLLRAPVSPILRCKPTLKLRICMQLP